MAAVTGGTAAATPTPRQAAARSPAGNDSELLAEVLRRQSVQSVYQPVVELDTGGVVGYEALSRGPRGSALERPDRLFAAARAAGRLSDLDLACQSAAMSGARAGGLHAPWTLLVNVEPEASSAAPLLRRPADGPAAADPAAQVIVEITERALTAGPAELLRMVARFRDAGLGLAVDDLGADPASLALLPLLRPDLIKLDLRLVQDKPSAHVAQIVNAVNAEAERNGAVVLAEGIETTEHLAVARSLGATLGQGWLLGRPGPLPDRLPAAPAAPIPISHRSEVPVGASPFALVAAHRQVRQASKSLLIEVSKHLERQALVSSESAVVLAAFQDVDYFTTSTRRRYLDLAASAAFVGALGAGMPTHPVPGVRGAVLGATDVVRGEWDIAVIGPHFAACLVARDLGDQGPDATRRFEYVLSHDRLLAVQVASALMARIHPDRPTLPVQRV